MKLIFLLFVFTCIIYTINGQQTTFSTKQCMENGGYCQNHWDCCSNSCLSYSYRCVRSSFTNRPLIDRRPHFAPSVYSSIVQFRIPNAENRFSKVDQLIDRFAGADISDTKESIIPTDRFQTVNKKRFNALIPSKISIQTISPLVQCSNIGQRCQYHSDCCSKSCLSYSYRCVKNHQNIQSTYNKPSYGGFYQPESSGAGQDINSIDELVDRFGGTDNDGSKSTTNAIVPQPTPIIDSIANVPIALPSTTTVRSVTIVCSNEGQRCFNANDCCNGNNTCSIENTCIFDERILITGSCLKTGSKCFKHEDCCSKICHGFLHQCVS